MTPLTAKISDPPPEQSPIPSVKIPYSSLYGGVSNGVHWDRNPSIGCWCITSSPKVHSYLPQKLVWQPVQALSGSTFGARVWDL